MRNLLLMVILLLTVPLLSAQEQETEEQVFVNAEGTFRLHYPVRWEIRERPDGAILLDTRTASLVITPPDLLETLFTLPTGDNPKEELIAALAGAFDENFSFEAGESVEGLDAVRADFASTTLPDATAAFIMAVQVDDTFTLVLAIERGDDPDAFEDEVIAIAHTFEIGTFARPGDPTGNLPILIHHHSDDIADAIAELQTLMLVSEGGEVIYDHDILMSGMQEGFTIDPNSASGYDSVAMAGRISLRPLQEGAFAICGLVSRASGSASDDLSDFLIVGPTADGRMIALENDASADERHLIERESPVDFHDPQHVLYIVREKRLTVFVNGEALIEDWPLRLPDEGDDVSYETLYIGANLDPGCVMTGVWAYGWSAGE
jgi:hypothetical protein